MVRQGRNKNQLRARRLKILNLAV